MASGKPLDLSEPRFPSRKWRCAGCLVGMQVSPSGSLTLLNLSRGFLCALWFYFKVIFWKNDTYVWVVKGTEILEKSGVDCQEDRARTHSQWPRYPQLQKLMDLLTAHLLWAWFLSLYCLSVLIIPALAGFACPNFLLSPDFSRSHFLPMALPKGILSASDPLLWLWSLHVAKFHICERGIWCQDLSFFTQGCMNIALESNRPQIKI